MEINVMINQSSSKITAPIIIYKTGVVVQIMQNGSFFNPPSLDQTQRVFIDTPSPFKSTSKLRRSIVVANKIMPISIDVNTAITNSYQNPPHLRLNNGVVLQSNILKSHSKIYENLGISINPPVIINVNKITSNSRFAIPKLTYLISEMFGFNDDVYVLVKDRENNFKIYKGVIRDKDPHDRRISIKAVLGEGVLGERIIKEDFDNQDIGITVKTIIEKYCSPLTAESVDINTGFFAPIKAKNKTALKIIEDIRREYGIYYYVDYTWDFHFYTEDAIQEKPELTIQLGDVND